MLVLTRRTGQRLLIGSKITIEVLEVSGNRVRLGIQAPEEVTVLRQELLRSDARCPGPEGEGSIS
jgi:carbon storage regulator